MSLIISSLSVMFYALMFYTTAQAQVSSLKDHDQMQNISINADELIAEQKKNIISYLGNVIVTQGSLKLRSEKLTALFKAQTISLLKAEGNVILTSPTEKIQSNWSIYDLPAKIITLGGKVSLITENGTIFGSRLIIDLKTGLMKLEGHETTQSGKRVTGEFKPAQ